jgi:hypothetical protein
LNKPAAVAGPPSPHLGNHEVHWTAFEKPLGATQGKLR